VLVRGALAVHRDVRQYQVIYDELGLHVLVVVGTGASAGECTAGVAIRSLVAADSARGEA